MAELDKELDMEEVEEELSESETKEEKFKRLSAQRVQKAAKYISALGNLANKSSYDYTEQDIEKVFGYLQKQLDDAKAKFEKSVEKNDEFSW